MSWIDGLRERLRPLFDRAGLEGELDDELAFHLEREIEANLEAGMSPREARRAAHASMGGPVRPAERTRAEWAGADLAAMAGEVRLGLRRLRRNPAFTAVAVLILALGIGANAAIFSIVRSVLARPLPYHEPGDVAFIWDRDQATETWLSARELLEYRAATSSFEELAAYTDFEVSLTEDAEPERVLGAAVTGNALEVLGVRPAVGRGFRPEEDLPGAEAVAILSHDLWQRRYGGDEGVIGRTVTANGQRATVVGVMPPEFRLPLDYRLERATDVFMPARIDEAANLSWGNRSWFVFGRLAPGVGADAATADVRAAAARWMQEGLVEDEGDGRFERAVVPVDDLLLTEVRGPLLILMGAVGLVLLLACANVAHLFLARAEARRTEVAVSAALGAGRLRLVRQYVIENGMLAAGGAALGVGLAMLLIRVAETAAPVTLIRMRGVELDGGVLAFTALLTAGSALLVGLLPGLRLSRVPLTAALGATRGSDRKGGRRSTRRSLVMAESALAVILVIGAALLGRSFAELSGLDLGFEPSGVLAAGITLPAADYPQPAEVGGFLRTYLDRVRGLSGVEAAGAVRNVPLAQSIGSWTITLEEPLPDPDAGVEPDWQIVTPGYVEAMGLELREGRALDSGDRAGGAPVALVSEGMAERYWPEGGALGKRFHLGTLNQPWVEIVGVVGSVRHNDMLEGPRVEMYLPHEQWPEIQGGGPARRTMSVVVRTGGDPLAVLPALRRELRALDPSIPLADPRPMSDVAAAAVAEQRFTAGLMGGFAALALLLAAVGLYGVTAYGVSRRTSELGIRMALGAGRARVAGLVVGEALASAGVGVVSGVLVAAALTRFLGSQLYGISPLDPLTFVAVPVALLAVAGLAAYLPARRAARIDPLETLRLDA